MKVSGHGTEQAVKNRHASRRTIYVTISAGLAFWIFVLGDSGWGPILTPLSSRLHIPLSIAGLFFVTWSIGYLPGALLGGVMLDRYRPKGILLGAALLVLGAVLLIWLCLLLPQYVPALILLAIAAVAGTGGGVIDATTNGLISKIFQHRRGTALNLFNLLYPLGGMLTTLVAAGLLAIFPNDPRPPFILYMAFIMIAIISLGGIPRNFKVDEEAPPDSPAGEELLEAGARRQRPLLLILAPVIVAMLLTLGINSSLRVWAPSYLHVAFGQTPAAAAALSSIMWALAAFSRVAAAELILFIGSWRMVMLGILVTFGGFALLMVSPNAIIATAAISIASVGLSPLFATDLALGSERAGRSAGSVAGILLCTNGVSAFTCSWLFGYLLNAVGPHWAVAFSLIFVALGGLVMLTIRPVSPARAARGKSEDVTADLERPLR